MEEKVPFEVVYEETFSYVYNYVYSQVLNKEMAEDLVSEVFIKAMTHYDGYDSSKASAKTWICNIARNSLIDTYRKNAKHGTSSLDEEGAVEPAYEDAYEVLSDPINQEVKEILERLSPEERELVSMIYFQEMKNPQIGEILGISAKAVSERHRRLLQKCRFMEKGKKASDYFD